MDHFDEYLAVRAGGRRAAAARTIRSVRPGGGRKNGGTGGRGPAGIPEGNRLQSGEEKRKHAGVAVLHGRQAGRELLPAASGGAEKGIAACMNQNRLPPGGAAFLLKNLFTPDPPDREQGDFSHRAHGITPFFYERMLYEASCEIHSFRLPAL